MGVQQCEHSLGCQKWVLLHLTLSSTFNSFFFLKCSCKYNSVEQQQKKRGQCILSDGPKGGKDKVIIEMGLWHTVKKNGDLLW